MSKRRPFMLYHWSPVSRRKSILRHGLRPLSKPTAEWEEDNWRAPWTCFSRYPNAAWAVSATHSKRPGKWDLWCVWSDRVGGYYLTRNVNKEWWLTEYRVPRAIPKKNIWLVGTREFKSARHS